MGLFTARRVRRVNGQPIFQRSTSNACPSYRRRTSTTNPVLVHHVVSTRDSTFFFRIQDVRILKIEGGKASKKKVGKAVDERESECDEYSTQQRHNNTALHSLVSDFSESIKIEGL